MPASRDIYKETPPPGAPPPPADLPPTAARARTWRATLLFSTAMLLLFGGAAGLIYWQDLQSERPGLAGGPAVAPPRMSLRAPSMLGSNMLPNVIFAPDASGLAAAEAAGARVAPEVAARALEQLRLANDYLLARRWEQAEAQVQTALQTWPQMPAALRLLGVLHIQRGRFDQGIAVLERLLRLDPSRVEVYNNLAAAYMQQRRLDKADELLHTALRIRPENALSLINLGLLALLRGQYGDAAAFLERARVQLPAEPRVLNNLAVAELRQGHYDVARRHLATLVAADPENALAYFNLAITYALDRRPDEAMAWIRRGARHCTALACQSYLADPDFKALRALPEFQGFLNSLHPELPPGP